MHAHQGEGGEDVRVGLLMGNDDVYIGDGGRFSVGVASFREEGSRVSEMHLSISFVRSEEEYHPVMRKATPRKASANRAQSQRHKIIRT